MIRIFLTIVISILCLSAQCQRVVDTTFNSNGRIAKAILELDEFSQKQKLVIFHNNGEVESEYFYNGDMQVRWIGYDSSGKKTGEWNERVDEKSTFLLKRSVALILVIIYIAGFTWFSIKRFGYESTYVGLGFLTVLISVAGKIAERYIDFESWSLFFVFVTVGIQVILPALLLTFSFSNFFRKRLMTISVACALFSAWILLRIGGAILTAGSGFLA